jgi:hypothetical protein
VVPYIAELSVRDLALVSELRLELSSGIIGGRVGATLDVRCGGVRGTIS